MSDEQIVGEVVSQDTTEPVVKSKKEKKIKMKKEKKEKKVKESGGNDKLDAILETNEQIVAGLNTLASVMKSFVEAPRPQSIPSPLNDTGAAVPSAPPSPHMLDDTRPNDYIPPRWRQIVDEVLSPDFGLRVKNFDDTTDFMIDIIVPRQYSSLTPKEVELGVQDIRSRMIQRSVGENGVRQWCEKIRTNLNKYYTAAGVTSPFRINS